MAQALIWFSGLRIKMTIVLIRGNRSVGGAGGTASLAS